MHKIWASRTGEVSLNSALPRRLTRLCGFPFIVVPFIGSLGCYRCDPIQHFADLARNSRADFSRRRTIRGLLREENQRRQTNVAGGRTFLQKLQLDLLEIDRATLWESVGHNV